MKITIGTGAKLFLLGLLISAVLTLAGSDGAAVSPSTMKAIIGLFDKCHICTIIDPLLTTIKSSVERLYSGISNGLVGLLLAFFSIWLVVFVMKYVTSAKERSGEEFFSDLIKQSLIVLFIAFLISSADKLLIFFDMIIYPLIAGFVDLGISIINTVGQSKISCSSEFSNVKSSVTEGSGVANSIQALGGPIKCLAEEIHKNLVPGMVLGGKMLSSKSIGFWPEFMGLFLLLFFIYLDLLFPLQLFDGLFRMAIMMLLFPLGLMLFAFKITRQFMVTIFLYFMATIVHLVVISIIFAICIIITTNAMKEINPQFFGLSEKQVQNTSAAGPQTPNYEITKSGIETITLANEADVKKTASMQIKELSMIAILIYMLYIINLFSQLVAMVMAIGAGNDTMSRGVRDKGIKVGIGIADGALNKMTGGRARLKVDPKV